MKKGFIIVFIFILLFLPSFALAQDTVDIHMFYGRGCPHCARASSYLNDQAIENPSLNVVLHETYFNDSERQLFHNMASAYGTEVEGVPTIFIDDLVFVGFSNDVADSLDSEIQKCLSQGCIDPLDKLDPELDSVLTRLTIPAVISAAAVDAINPCAFAVLIILLTTILGSKIRKRALFAGLAFSASIYISYFLMGIGLYSAIHATGISHTFYWAVAILAILIGLFNLKDYLWYGKWFTMEVPHSWRPKMKSLIKGVTSVPGAFLIGFVVSLFLLPCTSGPYIVILGLLAKAASRDYAVMLLLLYNIVFILPMILITLAIYFGFTTTEKAEAWRTKKLKVLHLIAGIIILCLGIAMIAAMQLGMI